MTYKVQHSNIGCLLCHANVSLRANNVQLHDTRRSTSHNYTTLSFWDRYMRAYKKGRWELWRQQWRPLDEGEPRLGGVYLQWRTLDEGEPRLGGVHWQWRPLDEGEPRLVAPPRWRWASSWRRLSAVAPPIWRWASSWQRLSAVAPPRWRWASSWQRSLIVVPPRWRLASSWRRLSATRWGPRTPRHIRRRCPAWSPSWYSAHGRRSSWHYGHQSPPPCHGWRRTLGPWCFALCQHEYRD